MIKTFSELCGTIRENSLTLATDSRKVQKNDVFIFMPLALSSHKGTQFPAIKYIDDAIKNGADHIVLTQDCYAAYEKEFTANPGIAFTLVENVRQSLGELAQISFKTEARRKQNFSKTCQRKTKR